LGHGGWLAWVDQHLSFGDRQARKYMRVAQHADQIGIENADLTIDGALAVIADPKPRSLPVPVTNRFDQALVILKRMKTIAAAAEAGDRDALREVIAEANRLTRLCQEIATRTLVGSPPGSDDPVVEVTGSDHEGYVWVTALVGSEVVGTRRAVRVDAVDGVLTVIGIDPNSLAWQFVPPIGLKGALNGEAVP
jgi:hypothetical protein